MLEGDGNVVRDVVEQGLAFGAASIVTDGLDLVPGGLAARQPVLPGGRGAGGAAALSGSLQRFLCERYGPEALADTRRPGLDEARRLRETLRTGAGRTVRFRAGARAAGTLLALPPGAGRVIRRFRKGDVA